MKTKNRFRIAIMAVLVIVSLMLQSGGVTTAKARTGLETAQQQDGNVPQEFSATRGEPFVPSRQPKPEPATPDDPRTPNLDLPPLPPDPDKEPVDSAPPERDRDYWTTPMTETFEGAFPTGLWNVFDNDGAAYGEYYWDDDDFKPQPPSYWSAWVANGGVNGVDPQYNNYANDMDTWMMYGPFDLSGCSAADFEFYYWNKSEANYDFFGWGASPNGSNVYGWELSGSQESWNYVDFDLAPYLGDTSVWLAFIFRSDSNVTDIGTFVDDITLWCLHETDVKSWTYMVYMDGDNNLESAAIDDFFELSSAGSDANVNIVVLMDRISGYDTSYDDWTDTRRFYITNGLTPAAANGVSWGESNMGDPETLLKFVRWAKAAYPANHYVLNIWDHGSGWREDLNENRIRDIASDATSGDSIDMPELRNSLSALTSGGANPFDILEMDACLMAMIEVDNQIKPYANIRVGSEKTEPNDGAPLDTILSALKANPAMSASTLATDMVDLYYASYGNNETQSAVNLGSSYTTLNNAVNNFAADLIYYGNNYIAEIQTARNSSTQFDDPSFIDLWDFADLVRVYIPEPNINASAIAVKNAVTATVIHEHHGSSWPWARGISIYFPKTPGEYDARYDGSSGFLQFTASTDWDEWIHTYHNFANYPTMFNKSSPANGATGQSVTPTLSWGASTGATSYQYCYDTLNDSACNGSYVSAGSNTSVVVSLSEATTYYWQVRAINASGMVYANKGTWWSLTTGNLPTAFNKTSPSNGATNQPLNPTLTWGASAGATSYEYCYDTSNDNACSGWTSNGTSTSKALSGLSQNTTYYWHVRALNSIGTRYSNGSSTAFWSFTINTYPLTVSKDGTGSGTVTSNPAGINCGADCSESYIYNTSVTLTAAPAAGSTFTGWSGACSGTGSCVLSMTSAKSVTATFTINTYTLTVSKDGTGSGTVTSNPAGINCGSTCSYAFAYNTVVTLTASPTSPSTFGGWSGGGCSGTGTCTVTMSSAQSVTATFNSSGKLTPTVTASGGPFTYDGASHTATVTGSVPGTVSNVKYNGSATVPTNADIYAVTADFVPTDTVTYNSLTGAAAGSITINKAALTVTANNQTIVAGSPDPASFTFVYSGFVPGEDATALTTEPTCTVSGAHSAVGVYPIACSNGAATNYSFSYVNGTLTVNAANSAPTDIALSSTAVNQNQPIGTVVGTFSSTDPDAGDTFTYSLVAGAGSTDNASFSISGNQLRTAAVFDFATKSSYSIRVRSTDSGSLFFDKEFTITVNSPAPPTTLVNSILPTSRSIQVGTLATVFHTVINAGANPAIGVTLSMASAPAGTFAYQQTDCATNAVLGSVNPSLDLAPGGVLCYVLSFTPSATFSATSVHIRAQASNAPSTTLLTGINTWLLRSTSVAGPDIIALTTTTDFHQIACSGANAFAVALSNVGAAATGDITAVANTGSTTLPLSISISETDPATGAVIGDHILQTVGAGENRTVAVFVTFNGCIAFDPAANRIFIEFRDASNNVVGSTSTAVSTGR